MQLACSNGQEGKGRGSETRAAAAARTAGGDRKLGTRRAGARAPPAPATGRDRAQCGRHCGEMSAAATESVAASARGASKIRIPLDTNESHLPAKEHC